jgi:hypothetical protein
MSCMCGAAEAEWWNVDQILPLLAGVEFLRLAITVKALAMTDHAGSDLAVSCGQAACKGLQRHQANVGCAR